MGDYINAISAAITAISIFANAATYIPSIYKWITDKRYLNAVLSSKNHHVLITQSLFGPGMISPHFMYNHTLLTKKSVISIQKITKALDKIKIPYDVFNTEKEAYDEIHIGGPLTNINTNAYIKQFFPNFHFCDFENKKNDYENFYKIHQSIIEYSNNFYGFIIENLNEHEGQKSKFPISKETDYMFLIKLTSKELGYSKTVHLIFGGSDIGTLVAADFFAKQYKTLYEQEKGKRYFLAIPVHKTNKTAAASTIINLTETMFNQISVEKQ